MTNLFHENNLAHLFSFAISPHGCVPFLLLPGTYQKEVISYGFLFLHESRFHPANILSFSGIPLLPPPGLHAGCLIFKLLIYYSQSWVLCQYFPKQSQYFYFIRGCLSAIIPATQGTSNHQNAIAAIRYCTLFRVQIAAGSRIQAFPFADALRKPQPAPLFPIPVPDK